LIFTQKEVRSCQPLAFLFAPLPFKATNITGAFYNIMDRATHPDDTTLTRILIGVGTAMKIELSLLIRKNLPIPVPSPRSAATSFGLSMMPVSKEKTDNGDLSSCIDQILGFIFYAVRQNWASGVALLWVGHV
jgi:hypothetical protein